MKKRCSNTKCRDYKYYGGKGILYDKSWESFENFLNDMGEKLQGLSLDRIDNSKGYSKKNCRWATWKEQSRNTSRNIKFKGECMLDASLRLGNYRDLVGKRIRAGWDIERAFTIPSFRS